MRARNTRAKREFRHHALDTDGEPGSVLAACTWVSLATRPAVWVGAHFILLSIPRHIRVCDSHRLSRTAGIVSTASFGDEHDARPASVLFRCLGKNPLCATRPFSSPQDRFGTIKIFFNICLKQENTIQRRLRREIAFAYIL